MSKYLDDFAVFILCHGRPDNVPTFDTLKNNGYSGRIIILCDDEDKTLSEYQSRYPEVQVFSKSEVRKYTDPMDNKGDMRCALYARNACFDVAEKEGIKYFAEFDDDYIGCIYRYEEDGVMYRSKKTNLDEVFDAYITFLETNENIYSVAFGQPGDFIGGVGSQLHKKQYRRKCMNSWICKTERRLQFAGTMNDDANQYFLEGHRGKVFLTFDFIMIDQPETQSVAGGMTDMYLGAGTYQKTFYSILQTPSFIKVGMMGDRHYRVHHNTNWENACPKIISDKYRKER